MWFLKKKRITREIDGDSLVRITSIDESVESYIGDALSSKKYHILWVGILLFIGILIAKSFYLQIIKGDYYFRLAEGNRTSREIILPNRGLIYDAQGTPLVKNIPLFEISIAPSLLPLNGEERDREVDRIARYVALDPLQVGEILSQYPYYLDEFISLRENLTYTEAIEKMISISEYPSLEIAVKTQRSYENNQAFSHILGYTGKITEDERARYKNDSYIFQDTIGKNGLELYYEELLRGASGTVDLEVNASGIGDTVLSRKESVSGKDIEITIDAILQKKVYTLTEQYLKMQGLHRAAVVLLDPRDGSIRSLVSYPEYNNQFFADGISTEQYEAYLQDSDNPLFNRVLKGEYPSGSTIKPVVSAAALNERLITDTTSFLSTGGLWIAEKWFFPDWKSGGHGLTNVYHALADSVNTFFYIIGGGYEDIEGLGLDRLVKYYTLFGLGARTGIDLPGENTGLVPTREWKLKHKKEEWYIGDTYHMAIGQGDVLVTPLQVAQWTAYFANRGVNYVPHLLGAVIDGDGVRIPYQKQEEKKDLVDAYSVGVVNRGMREGVLSGSSRSLLSLPVTSAGKTGTAQFSTVKAPHAWFSGYAPYESPEVVIVVLIEEGKEGSLTAVELSRQILEYYFGEYKQNTQVTTE